MPRISSNGRYNPYGNGNLNNRSTIPVQLGPQTIPLQQRPQGNPNVQTGRFRTGQNVVYPQQPRYTVPQQSVLIPVVHVPRTTVLYAPPQPQYIGNNAIRVNGATANCTVCGVLAALLVVSAVALLILGGILLAVLL